MKGAAWSVPVLAAAVAVPARAASVPATPVTADLQMVSIAWMPQGGPGDVPPPGPDGRPTFTAGSGLFVDVTIRNNGPDPVTGLRCLVSFTYQGHDTSSGTPLSPHTPTTGWSYVTNYDQSGLRRVFMFDNPSITLAPGQSTVIRVLYSTTTIPGHLDQGTRPYAAVGATGANVTDPNLGNNDGFTSNSYNVQT